MSLLVMQRKSLHPLGGQGGETRLLGITMGKYLQLPLCHSLHQPRAKRLSENPSEEFPFSSRSIEELRPWTSDEDWAEVKDLLTSYLATVKMLRREVLAGKADLSQVGLSYFGSTYCVPST